MGIQWIASIHANNAAFGDGDEHHPTRSELVEVARILRQTANHLESLELVRASDGTLRRPLRDINGNAVGTIRRSATA